MKDGVPGGMPSFFLSIFGSLKYHYGESEYPRTLCTQPNRAAAHWWREDGII